MPTSIVNVSGDALVWQVAEVDARVADGGQVRVVQRLLVPVGQRAPDGVVQHRLAAHPLEHDLGRHLALAEARDLEVAAELAGGFLHLPLHRVGGDLHLHADARVTELGGACRNGSGHGRATIA